MNKIEGVALRIDGRVYSLPKPARHCDLFQVPEYQKARQEAIAKRIWIEQGFIDSQGEFVDRTAALKLAMDGDQILDRDNLRGHQLFSEDVW